MNAYPCNTQWCVSSRHSISCLSGVLLIQNMTYVTDCLTTILLGDTKYIMEPKTNSSSFIDDRFGNLDVLVELNSLRYESDNITEKSNYHAQWWNTRMRHRSFRLLYTSMRNVTINQSSSSNWLGWCDDTIELYNDLFVFCIEHNEYTLNDI